MTGQPARYHSFSELVLTVAEPALADVSTEHRYELRSTGSGAEVWRVSSLSASGGACYSEPSLIGWLTTRQIIDLLTALERSGVYDASLADVEASLTPLDDDQPVVSIALRTAGNATRTLVDAASAGSGRVRAALELLRDAIGAAQERALAWAG